MFSRFYERFLDVRVNQICCAYIPQVNIRKCFVRTTDSSLCLVAPRLTFEQVGLQSNTEDKGQLYIAISPGSCSTKPSHNRECAQKITARLKLQNCFLLRTSDFTVYQRAMAQQKCIHRACICVIILLTVLYLLRLSILVWR